MNRCPDCGMNRAVCICPRGERERAEAEREADRQRHWKEQNMDALGEVKAALAKAQEALGPVIDYLVNRTPDCQWAREAALRSLRDAGFLPDEEER